MILVGHVGEPRALTSEADALEVGDPARLTEILGRLGGPVVQGVALEPVVVQVEGHAVPTILTQL